MKTRGKAEILDELVASAAVGRTVGDLAESISDSTLQQILADGARMHLGSNGLEIEANLAALVYAMVDRAATLITRVGRDDLVEPYRKTAASMPLQVQHEPGEPAVCSYCGGKAEYLGDSEAGPSIFKCDKCGRYLRECYQCGNLFESHDDKSRIVVCPGCKDSL